MSEGGYSMSQGLRVYNQKRSQRILKQYVGVSNSFANGSREKIHKAYTSLS